MDATAGAAIIHAQLTSEPSLSRILRGQALDGVQEKFQQMLQDWLKLPRSERWPVHLQDHISMFVYDCGGLLFVAFTLENMQPLQVFESLRAITVFLQAAFGGLTEEKVRPPRTHVPPAPTPPRTPPLHRSMHNKAHS